MGRMRVLVISAVLASVLLGLMHRAEAKVPLLSREEDLELERQLKILNKPPLISFKFAGITTPNDGAHKFYGAQTVISVFNVAVVDNQTSVASMWLGSDVEGPFNGLEYGWTSDGFKSTGCFNALCPGYVQVSKRRVMGQAERFVSTYAKTIYKRRFLLHKDTKSGNWWLSEYIANGTNEPVGYWPRELFPSMSDYAAMAQFGGKVYSPPKVSPPAPMGSGHFVSNDFVRTCSASQIVFVEAFGQFYAPRDADIQVVADVPDVYYVEYLGDATRKHPRREFVVLFGGPDIIIKH
ncbi:hypothetical protein Nepgr_020255 [Nepenthes gracilis]|uniref:Neprosin PEP catalytic domain-containing protein n=1 Tax=Nepenthes gracilis TaxID=150966 RepID=A0AAD3SWM3_NEPGR|nr:hypothetical protein Nepgr_020255 [Nepenthes gracilis]